MQESKRNFPFGSKAAAQSSKKLLIRGFCCIIKSVNNQLLPKELLGKALSDETAEVMAAHGIDLCGENGEYHTIAVDGPVFKQKLEFDLGEIMDFGSRSVIEIR